MELIISGRSFKIDDLQLEKRMPGISAFMRIKNGAEFLEMTIRSHIPYFDEIVAVYNQSTDETASILHRLQQEFGSKLKVYHYSDRVFPPGSEDHAKTDPSSPNSLVNYYNVALSLTTRTVTTKLDDDHLALESQLAKAITGIRSRNGRLKDMLCFSGLNILKNANGNFAIPEADPISGNGDIGFFEVTKDTYFKHDRRFERFERGSARRVFCGYLYWHLKYMKQGMGFQNYEIRSNPNSRYARKASRMKGGLFRLQDLQATMRQLEPVLLDRMKAFLSDKYRFTMDRDQALSYSFTTNDLETAIRETVLPDYFSRLVTLPTRMPDAELAG